MKAADIRNKSLDELKDELSELLEKQFRMRMKASTGQHTKTHEIKQIRKDVARIKTIMNENKGK